MEDDITEINTKVIPINSEYRVDSRMIAKDIKVKHDNLMQTIRKYQVGMEKYGKVLFETGASGKTKQKQIYALLNREQFGYLLMFVRVTEKVRAFREYVYDKFIEYEKSQPNSVQAPFLNTLWTRRALIFNGKTLIPDGYWCIFNEIGHICWQMELKDVHLTEESTPDISVGQLWAKYARSKGLDMSLAKKYDHHYPPGDRRGIQQAYIYPNAWYGEFRDWFQIQYLKVDFKKYLVTHMVINGELPGPKQGQIE